MHGPAAAVAVAVDAAAADIAAVDMAAVITPVAVIAAPDRTTTTARTAASSSVHRFTQHHTSMRRITTVRNIGRYKTLRRPITSRSLTARRHQRVKVRFSVPKKAPLILKCRIARADGSGS